MFLLYDLALMAAALVLAPYYLLRGVRRGQKRHGIRERLGILAAGRLSPLGGRPVIWVHAVSVGETRAAIPLLRALRSRYPGHALLVTNVTETGHRVAEEIPEVDLSLFFPFDFSWVVRRVLGAVRPELIAIVETEIWPNFVRCAREMGVPVALVNGRISDRSFPRYRSVSPLLAPVLRKFSVLCMQTEADAERIRALGAPPERVAVTRNLKFDMAAGKTTAETAAQLRERYRLPLEAPVWVAGSTHAGEEEAIAEVHRRLNEEGRGVILVLVPRHPERCRTVAETLSRLGHPFELRSALSGLDRMLRPGEVLLVDTLGEMLDLYRSADLVFVGGSLVPIGGHNVLEASLVKKPVLFGPYMQNFKEIASLMLRVGGGFQVADKDGLADAVRGLLDDPARRAEMGVAGYAEVQRHAGATGRTMGILSRLLEGSHGGEV